MYHSQNTEANIYHALQGYDKIGIFIVATDFTCTEWNVGMESFTGIKKSEVIDQNIVKKIPSLEKSPCFNFIKQAFNSEKNQIHDQPCFSSQENSEEIYSFSFLPVFKDSNECEGCLIIMTPVDKKESQIEIIKSEKRFRSLFEKNSSPMAISRMGNYVQVNEAFLKLFKYKSAEDLIGTSLLNQLDNSQHEEITEIIKARYEGKEAPNTLELIGIKKDGSKFPFQLEVSYIELPDGMATVVMLQDISERKIAEAAIRDSETKFRGIFESNMVGITFTDRNSLIHDANEKFLTMIQYDKSDIGKLSWMQISPPGYEEKDANAIKEYFEKGYFTPYEKELIRKDGTRIPVLIAASILNSGMGLGISFIVDISDLKESKEEAHRVTNELSTFLYMASHDLKGPLASVIGLTNIAKNDVEDKEALNYLNLIQECTKKLDRSLMNFLKIIKIKNNNQEYLPIDFSSIIKEVISSLKHQDEFSNAEFTISNNLNYAFSADPDLIKSIFQNLIENSVKYQTRMRAPMVKISLNEDPQNIYIAVDDNGRGIDEKIKHKIFNMFYRGDISSKGSGLGLYIVKSAVEKIDGTIDVNNKATGGVVFKMQFPKKASV
jgi:PAS domain S-box-containing protein